uniref:Uncharacterized protein n=1 Tax=Anopheles minimus TaxID=112268 RepID=A0A182WNA1_9DIPT
MARHRSKRDPNVNAIESPHNVDQVARMLQAQNDKFFNRIVKRLLLCPPVNRNQRNRRNRRYAVTPPLQKTARDIRSWQHCTKRILFRPFPPLATVFGRKSYPEHMYG